jgi:hypothetical protein
VSIHVNPRSPDRLSTLLPQPYAIGGGPQTTNVRLAKHNHNIYHSSSAEE